ncbi:CaiB/BaiF CoA transferase family protein [Nocardia arizonensis]|uniref:CaiB/BaiF CoA transferase family protein n=1 Tax=Nocardia arizonensis TaxID=1141647 RepID=UPI0006D0A585|nr:CaiB/BaiF CoA-transferase family protein [Nocardia arizonensis]
MTLPLRGIRVIELSGIGPSRYCGMLLADLGAEVVLVERPGQQPRRADTVVARGRRGITLDLKQSGDVETLLRLVERADVLIEPYRPGVAERLGIGPEHCQARNPGLVYGRMTGWGQDGPLAGTAGHDIGYIAVTGVLDAIGRADGPPQVPLNLLGDFAGGSMFLLTGILAGLWQRQRTGAGTVVDAAIIDGTVSLASFILGLRADGEWSDGRGTNLLDTGAPYYDVYETSDGGWMAVGAIEPKFYAELLRVLELSGLPPQNDRETWPQLRAALAARFRERTREMWTRAFHGTDACVAPVLNFAEAAEHPQIAARGSLTMRAGHLISAVAPRLSTAPNEPARDPVAPGSDTEAVLRDWCGD